MVVTCPECEGKLRLKSAPPRGKKVRCPRCEATFLPDDDDSGGRRKAPVKAKRRASRDDDDEDDYDDRPSRKKGRKKKSRALFLTLCIGGPILGIGILFLVLILCGVFENKYVKQMKEGIKLNNELADILESVKDAESAKAAVPKLEEFAAKASEFVKKQRGMGVPSPSEAEAAMQYAPEHNQALQRVSRARFAVLKYIQNDQAFSTALNKVRIGF
jgi:predicted Zn finger-like uncharacterized protein